MKRGTAIAAVLVAAVLMAFTMSARAQDLNPQEKTFLTFSGPVELPGMTLPAGTYTFKLAESPMRNVGSPLAAIFSRATSDCSSLPTTFAVNSRRSARRMRTVSAPSTT